MCNNNCNKNNCNCKNQCNNCEPVDCGCKIELDTLCVYYTGQGISPLGVKSGQNLTEILELINNYLEFLLDEIEVLSTIKNIGDGAEIYAGRDNATRANTLRTLKSSDSVEVIENEDTISFEVEIPDVDVSNINTNVGTETPEGNEVYKGYNSTTKKHEFRRIISDTLIVKEEGDNLRIEAEEVDLGGVRNFYVNNKYNGDEELGTIAKPYRTLDKAIEEYIGNINGETQFSPANPLNLGSKIIVQTSKTTYEFVNELSIVNLDIEVESGAIIRFKGDSDYMLDTRTIINDPQFDGRNFLVTVSGDGGYYSLKGLIYAKGSETDGSTAFERYAVVINGNGDFRSLYRVSINDPDVTTIPITKGTTTPVIQRQGGDSLFFNGDVMEIPAIVCDGDNGISSNITFSRGSEAKFRSGTQTLIYVKNKGYFDGFNADKVTFGYAQGNIGHYGGLDENVQNGEENILLHNQDFNFINIENGNIRLNDFLTTTAGTITAVDTLFLSNSNGTDAALFIFQAGEFFSNFQVRKLISISNSTSFVHTFNNLVVNGASPKDFTIEYTGSGTLTNAIINDCNISKISDNIDLTRSNNSSVVNRISGKIVESLKRYENRVDAENVSQDNPIGTKFINTNENNANTSTWFIDITMQ